MAASSIPDRPAVLVADRGLARIADRLDAYEVHRLWEHDDPLAYAAGPGKNIRAIVAMGGAPLDKALVEAMPNLGLIACLASGYEGVDARHARKRGVEVTHSRSANHEDVADHTLALFLAAHRRIIQGDQWVRAGTWGKETFPQMRTINTMKVGIAGLGVIGRSVARRLEPFGCEVAWWGRNPQPDAKHPRKDSLKALAEWSDVLIVAARADGSNIGLFNAEIFDALGPRGLIVNVSRGSIVNEADLIAALKEGRLGGAALDVFETEPTPPERWADVPNLVLTPHSAGMSDTAGPLIVGLMLENLKAFFAGEPLPSPVPRD